MTFDYQRYLASREWALLKEQVRERCDGWCEHCHAGPYQSTHHLTYERTGHEDLNDLAALCNPCHEWISGKTTRNPLSIAWLICERVTPDDGTAVHIVSPLLSRDSYHPDFAAVLLAKLTCGHPAHSLFGLCSWCTAGCVSLTDFLLDIREQTR